MNPKYNEIQRNQQSLNKPGWNDTTAADITQADATANESQGNKEGSKDSCNSEEDQGANANEAAGSETVIKPDAK